MNLQLPDRAFPLAPTRVMGILNVTPDSFSDGGDYFGLEAAVARAREMVAEGADIIDVGGESTRPGSTPLSAAEEMRRVLPVIERIRDIADPRAPRAARGARPRVPVSVDTRHPETARAAAAAGASIVNCVEELTEEMAAAVRETGTALVARCRGRADYDRAVALAGGRDRVLFDPMVGFGTDRAEDVRLIARIPEFAAYAPVLAAVSRKRVIGALAGGAAPKDRLGGSVGAAVWCALNGACVVRVHDVRETAQALALVNHVDAAARREGGVPA